MDEFATWFDVLEAQRISGALAPDDYVDALLSVLDTDEAGLVLRRLAREASDLRRQVEHANRWRDTAIGEANEARAAAADLWHQLEATQAEIAAMRRQLAEAQAAIAAAPREEIDDLYDAYAHAVAGSEMHAQFPQVGRWLGILPANTDDNTPPHRPATGEGE